MTHLTPDELVDIADGVRLESATPHLEACAECRAALAELRAMMSAIADVDVPEPSPLFWDHFSARVRGAVAEERLSAQRSGWFSWSSEVTRGMVPVAATAVLVVALLVGAVMTRRSARAPEAMAARTPAPAGAPLVPAADDAALDAANSEVWDVLTAAASDMQIEDAREAGMTVRPGAIDRAVQKMAPDELNELGRLLQSELKHSGA